MKLTEFVKRAEESEVIRSRLSSGFRLSSVLFISEGFALPEGVTLVYYNPGTGKVFSAGVGAAGVSVGGEDDPLVKAEYAEVSVPDDLVVEHVLVVVEKRIREERLRESRIIVVWREGKWIVQVITQNLLSVRMDVSPQGEVLLFEKSPLIHPPAS
ncbi:MAG: hypothetical protein JW834_03200 [Candidatus Diapherotrites archaeon]|nr:hypothetical protein [Candidatus Diapherotrites archaeon]